ncbi:MAG: response regulator transcription factor [Lachnospirales bacterium]
MALILIAEDDKEIAMLEKDYLEINDFEVIIASDGLKAEELIKKNDFDLIILDIMLPQKSGYDICRDIRNIIDVPILMVTAKTESIDKIRGLGLGADDYIVKPFDPAELVARVKSHIAQYNRLTNKNNGNSNNNSDGKDYCVNIGNTKIMLKSWKVIKNGVEIKFPNKEFELLKFLALNPNIVFSKEQLFEKIWGYDYVGDNATVTVHINRIRDKIEDDPKNPKIIETVWGAGYRLNINL